MELFLWGGVFVGFVIACAWFNYRAGVEHGVNITLTTLEKSGLINIAEINENKIKAVIENENRT